MFYLREILQKYFYCSGSIGHTCGVYLMDLPAGITKDNTENTK